MNELEKVQISLPIVIDFVLYSILMLGIGFYFWKKNKTSEDYFIGDKGMGPFVSALSAGASDMSSWLLMGLPGAILLHGLGQTYIAIGLSIGALINWLFIAKRLRIYTDVRRDCITIPDFFETRFTDDSHILRILCAIVILIFFTVYISSGLVAGGKLFEQLFSVKYEQAVITGAVLIVVYTFVGGYKAVCWTDLIQGILMMCALIIVPVVMINEIGGFNEAVNIIVKLGEESQKDYISMGKNLSLVAIISSLAWGLGYFGQPHIIVRFISIKSTKDIPTATVVGISWMVISLIGAVLMGFIGIAYLEKFNINLMDKDRIFIVTSQLLFNPWISGVLLSAILAAIMSTASSQLLVSSSTLAEDFYRKIFHKNAPANVVMKVSRISVLIVAIVAFVISADKNTNIIDIVGYAWAGFGASFGSVILFSLFWKNMSRLGAILGMSFGAIGVIVWEHIDYFGVAKTGIFTLYSIIPGFIVAAIFIIIGSYIQPARISTKQAYDDMLTKL